MSGALPAWPHDLTPLPAAFFDRAPDAVARDLLGKVLLSRAGGAVTGGPVVECEAYLGSHDEGSHAATRGITRRNAVMYGPPATLYVYFTYGNHHMVNLVCDREGVAGAVLVRALEPSYGAEAMSQRRGTIDTRLLTSGPGRLAAALGVDLADNGSPLGAGRAAVFDGPAPSETGVSGRIGLARGHEAPLRFYALGNAYVSKGRPGPSAGRGRAARRSEESAR